MKNIEYIKKIQNSENFADAYKYLKDLNLKDLTTRNFTKLARTFKKFEEAFDYKIAYLSNFTIDFLPSFTSVFAAKEQIKVDSYTAPYNQYFQEVLMENSGLAVFKPDIIFLSLALDLIEPEAINSFSSMADGEKIATKNKIIEYYKKWIANAKKRFDATILITNFPMPAHTQNGIADQNDSYGEILFYCDLNKELAELVRKESRIHIFDLAKLYARFGSENVLDPKMYYMAKILWKDQFLPTISEEILRFLIPLKGLTKKCLVLDLDNTLWGGVVGEDGLYGIKVGQGDPVSEAYYDFQKKIKFLKNRGIMLAVCSKNNEPDVIEVFENRKEMPLQFSDFVACRINWEHKHLNIAQVAEELNIGLDSMVFLDDNPVECEMVQTMLPSVKVVRVPSNPEEISPLIDRLIDFEKVAILKEDKEKTHQYRQNKNRVELKESIGDINEYLESLKTEITIRPFQKKDFERTHQLFAKTNQFNVTTQRYSLGDVESFFYSALHEVFVISCQDKFGDLGIIGLCLIEFREKEADIDSFILSCRAMGRNIEVAIMNHIKSFCFFGRKLTVLNAKYIPTAKNIPVRTFFDDQGFEKIEILADGQINYQLASNKWQLADCGGIRINNNGETDDRRN